MKIKVPLRVAQAWDAFYTFVNVPLFTIRKRSFLRIDAILLVSAIACGVYYYFASGLLGAVTGVAIFAFVAMCAIWVF